MKTPAPCVSVIIPTFNRVKLLKETVQSVRNQTFRDFEIIVVNDGSSDGTKEWLDSQMDVRAVHQNNQGIARSRNNGAAKARGTWFSFLDHDDLWAPEKLEVQVRFAREHPEIGLIATKHVRLGSSYRIPRKSRWIYGDLLAKEYGESFIHTSSVMIRRDTFAAVGGFPPRYRFADEFDVWLKIASRYPIGYFGHPLVFIRFYEANTSHNRVGVRSDTYDILLQNYDPERIPVRVFLKTLSDHDISFGRAYLNEGDFENALHWFRSSVERTPWRLRSWRYFLKFVVMRALRRRGNKNLPDVKK
jgi:glycosyltransferase involved in cell wall biosynthesis